MENKNENINLKVENETEKKKDKWFFPALIIAVIVSFLCNMFLFQLAQVNGSSMYPTMENGNLLVVSKIADKDKYERGDIIVFKENGNKLIKRLIGLPGETIQIINNDIYINGNKIKDYVDVEMEDYGILNNKIELKDNEFFFMGDNRNNSSDCRVFGPIKKENIIGKIVVSLIPFNTKF